MNTSTVILNTTTILRNVGRASLVIAWLAAQHQTMTAKDDVSFEPIATADAQAIVMPFAAASSDCTRAALPVPAERAPVVAPAVELDVDERQARSKCGDLPRAPWNTCVALHDHEI